MAPVLNICAEICRWLDHPDDDTDHTGWINRMRRDMQEMKSNAANMTERMTNRFQKLNVDGNRFGFYSWSSTVATGLRAQAKQLAGKRAFVAQSNPGGEGTQTAEFLAKLGWQVWLVSDTQFSDMARHSKLDRLILGCDAYSTTRFVNKIGSGALAGLMRTAEKPVELWTNEDKHLHDQEIQELDLGKHEPSPPVATGIATPSPLFGTGMMDDISIIRTPDDDIEPDQLATRQFRRAHPVSDYLKLENRPG